VGAGTVNGLPVVRPEPENEICVAVPDESPVALAVIVTSVPVVTRDADDDVVMDEMTNALVRGTSNNSNNPTLSAFLSKPMWFTILKSPNTSEK